MLIKRYIIAIWKNCIRYEKHVGASQMNDSQLTTVGIKCCRNSINFPRYPIRFTSFIYRHTLCFAMNTEVKRNELHLNQNYDIKS